MKKLIVSILVCVFLFAGALTIMTACDKDPTPTPDDGPLTDYSHTIVFYSTMGQTLRGVLDPIIEDFEAAHPGWKVEHNYSAGNYDNLKNLITNDLRTGTQPDLAYCYPDHVASYLATRKVVDLSKYLTSSEELTFNGVTERIGYTDDELADFYDIFMEEGRAENYFEYDRYGYNEESVLTMPFIKSTELLYYNQDALLAAADMLLAQNRADDAALFAEISDGKAVTAKPADTWDILWKQAPILKQLYPNCTPLAYDSEDNWFITMCQQNNWGYTSMDAGHHYLWTENNDGLVAWLTGLKAKIDAGLFMTSTTLDATGETYTSTVFTQGVGTLSDGTKVDGGQGGGAIYCIGSSGGASYQSTQNFTVRIAPIPGSVVGGRTNYSAISQGPSFVMFSGGNKVTNVEEKEKMTFLFMKALLDATSQVQFSMANGYCPSRASCYDIEAFDDYLNLNNTVSLAVKTAGTMTSRFFTSPAFDGSSNARDAVGAALVSILSGANVQTALRNALNACGGNSN